MYLLSVCLSVCLALAASSRHVHAAPPFPQAEAVRCQPPPQNMLHPHRQRALLSLCHPSPRLRQGRAAPNPRVRMALLTKAQFISKQQIRWLSLHEQESQNLLQEVQMQHEQTRLNFRCFLLARRRSTPHNVTVRRGRVATSPDEAKTIAE